MARHKDIRNVHAKLEGEGWHIEYHREADYRSTKRRSCQRCTYFNYGVCNYAHAPCMGVDCGSYSEKTFTK